MATHAVVARSQSRRRVGPGPGASPHRVAALPPARRLHSARVAPASCRPWRPVGSASRPRWSESLVCDPSRLLENDPVAFPVAPVAFPVGAFVFIVGAVVFRVGTVVFRVGARVGASGSAARPLAAASRPRDVASRDGDSARGVPWPEARSRWFDPRGGVRMWHYQFSSVRCVCPLPVGRATLRLVVRSNGARCADALGFRRVSTSSESTGRLARQPVVSGRLRT